MVIVDDEDVKVDTRSLITYSRQCRAKQRIQKYLPDEIWLDILSRLPIKSLCTSRFVSKCWRNFFFTVKNKINTDPGYVPVSGLLLISLNRIEDGNKLDYFGSYFCLRANGNFIIRRDSPENKLVSSSGFKRELLNDLKFDFSIIQKVILDPERNFFSYILNGGLILLTLTNGTSQVHNPATKQVHFVPMSGTVKRHWFNDRSLEEVCGLVIQFPSNPTQQGCRFIVVTFCITMKIMEVYYSWTREWRKFRLKLDDELLSSTIQWRLMNYVSLFESGVLSLYTLNNRDCGVAIKFGNQRYSMIEQYRFPLPNVVYGGIGNVRIWECEKNLYLTYYKDTGLWIWKADSTKFDAWSWVSVLEISRARKFCKPVARKHLSEPVLNSSVRVQPIACHPDVAVVYLLVKSSIFAYNLKADRLEKIGKMKDYKYRNLDFAFTYRPCPSFMDPSEVV